MPRSDLRREVMLLAVLALVLVSVNVGLERIAVAPAFAQTASGARSLAPKRNPNSTLGFEIEFRFGNLPGALKDIVAFAHYEIDNRECVPLDYARAPGGVRLPPVHRMDLPLEHRAGDVLSARVYEDALANADLFGLGECRWRMDSVTLTFRSSVTQFVGGAGIGQIRASKVEVQHYLVRDYFEKPAVVGQVFGEKADHYLATLGPQFMLTTAAHPIR